MLLGSSQVVPVFIYVYFAASEKTGCSYKEISECMVNMKS